MRHGRAVRARLLLLAISIAIVTNAEGVCPVRDECGGRMEDAVGGTLPCINSLLTLDTPAGRHSNQGMLLARYNQTTSATDTNPSIPTPGSLGSPLAFNQTITTLHLYQPGAAAWYYTKHVEDANQVLSFEWYLCSRSYKGNEQLVALQDAEQLSQQAQQRCNASCSQWCSQDTCVAGCCPVAIPECSLCPSSCSALCSKCQDDCANQIVPVQTARVDLWTAPSTIPMPQFVNMLHSTVLLPDVGACNATLGCNRTLLAPADMGAAETQCGWQVYNMPLAAYVGMHVALVLRALDTRAPFTSRLGLALDNVITLCEDPNHMPPYASLDVPPLASPSPPPPPSYPLPPAPPLGCYASSCSRVLGTTMDMASGDLGPCIATPLDSPGSSGFVPFQVDRALSGLGMIPPPPGLDRATVAALQLEQMGAAALVYNKFIASPDEVLTMEWYMCASSYTGDDMFSLSGLLQLIGQNSGECNNQCNSNCTACSFKCCTPAPCNQTCMRDCCFSCWARCNGLALSLQTARLDVYNASGPASALAPIPLDQLTGYLFSTDDPCQAAEGCTTLIDPGSMIQDQNCAWRSNSWSMAAYAGQYVSVVFRALDSLGPHLMPLSFAVHSISSECPSPPMPATPPPPPSPQPPFPPPAPPAPPYGQCVPNTCDGSFESGLGTCMATYYEPTNHTGGFQVAPYNTNITKNVTTPIIPQPTDGQGGTYMAKLTQDAPGAAALVWTKFISSPDEQLSFRWFVCTAYKLSDGPYTFWDAVSVDARARQECLGQCAPYCASDSSMTSYCQTQCCTPTCSAKCQFDCITQCVTCKGKCNNTSPRTQAFRVDLYRVAWASSILPAADQVIGMPCDPAQGCLTTLVDYFTANASLCQWQTTRLSMAPYAGMTVALVVRAVDMRYPRARQLAAAVDDITCDCVPQALPETAVPPPPALPPPVSPPADTNTTRRQARRSQLAWWRENVSLQQLLGWLAGAHQKHQQQEQASGPDSEVHAQPQHSDDGNTHGGMHKPYEGYPVHVSRRLLGPVWGLEALQQGLSQEADAQERLPAIGGKSTATQSSTGEALGDIELEDLEGPQVASGRQQSKGHVAHVQGEDHDRIGSAGGGRGAAGCALDEGGEQRHKVAAEGMQREEGQRRSSTAPER